MWSSLSSTVNVTVNDRRFAYDGAARLTGLATTAAALPNDNQCFGYDRLDNLTQAWTPADGNCDLPPSAAALGGPAPYWTSWGVDPASGNRGRTTQHSANALTYDVYSYPAAGQPHPHAVQTVTHSAGGTDSYGTDAAGNVLARPGQTLSYDALGRLSSLTTTADGKEQTSVYDATGNLLVQTDPTNGTTAFLGDTELHVAAGSTTVTARRTYRFHGMDVAERDTADGVAGSTLYWLDPDPMGTATTEIRVSDSAVTRRYTDPFGVPRGPAVTWSSDRTVSSMRRCRRSAG